MSLTRIEKYSERGSLRFAHRRPTYFTQLAEPDPTPVSDLKISHGKLVKKKHDAKEAQGPSCCMVKKVFFDFFFLIGFRILVESLPYKGEVKNFRNEFW